MENATKQQYRAVLCTYCQDPIPLPAIVVRIEKALKDKELDSEQDFNSRVFTLRCGACHQEFPYRASAIISCDGTPGIGKSHSRKARSLLRDAVGIAQTAKAAS